MSTTASRAGNPWVVRPQVNTAAGLRIFCFPYAGLGASVYRTWAAALPKTIDMVAIQPPGREGRWTEKALPSVAALAPAIADAIQPLLTMPFVFYGHSLGGVVAFEVIRHLRQRRQAQPLHLFVGAHRAPQLPNPHPELRALPDRQFINEVVARYGGIPQAVLDNPELIELMLPCMRADFTAFETYRYTDDAPLDFPISAFGGRRDNRIEEREIAAWAAQTTAAFRYEMLDGNHFFLQDRRDQLIAGIVRDLAAVGAPASA